MTHTTSTPAIEPDRLFAAANELLRAIDSPDGFDTEISMYAGPLPVGTSLSTGIFTSEELIEAMSMLIRLGFVPSTNSGTHRAGHRPTLPARKAG